jgi:hypothetical protein
VKGEGALESVDDSTDQSNCIEMFEVLAASRRNILGHGMAHSGEITSPRHVTAHRKGS